MKTSRSARFAFNRCSASKMLALWMSFACALPVVAQQARPDALLQIDHNRAAVVERIVQGWKAELAPAQIDDLRAKLMGLRADQLLSANVSGSFDGVLEVLQRAQPLAPPMRTVQAKAVGEPARDLVYTPITPCRIFDTRPASGGTGAMGTGERRDFEVIATSFAAQGGAATDCGIDPGAVAVAVNLTATGALGSGNLRAFPSSLVTPPNASNLNWAPATTQTSEANFAIVPICTASCPSGKELSVLTSSSVNVVADVAGYFMPPTRAGDGLRVISTLSGSPNVINGDSSNTITASDGATIGGGINNSTSGTISTISGGSGNSITGASSSGTGTTIGGGENNVANGDRNTIAGGVSNQTASSSSTVGGGVLNAATGVRSTVPGGDRNTASGRASFAAGSRAKAVNDGAFVWGDNSAFDFSSTAANEFNARATGGFRLVTAIDATGAPTKTFAIAPTTGNLTTQGRIDATDDIATAADLTASGNISAGVDVLATRNVTATQNVVANNKFVASRNLSTAVGTKAIGDRFRDNSIIAWATVGLGGTSTASFGITSVTRTATGAYRVVIDVSASAAPTSVSANLVPIAIAEIDSQPTTAAEMRVVSVNQFNANSFDIWINNGTGAAVDNQFTLIVTGR